MGRRSLLLPGILLLCIFIGACNKKESKEELISQDNNMYIDEIETNNEDINMAVNNEENRVNNINSDMETFADRKELLYTEDVRVKYSDFSAGTVINVTEFDLDTLNSLFFIKELDKNIIERITGKSFKEDCDIPYSDLRYIRVLHTDFDGQTRIGEMIVNKAIAQDVVDIFMELYSISYPIEKMLLIDEYDADDIKSMEDNNSSAFNFRFIEGTTKRSVHSDGLAIDINPLYNPYVRTRNEKLEVLPESATEHVDRSKDNIYYIKKDDPCYKAFTKRGFTWGGEWKNSKDYQHFEKKIEN